MSFTSEEAKAAQAKSAASKRARKVKDDKKLPDYKMPMTPQGTVYFDQLLVDAVSGELGNTIRENVTSQLLDEAISIATNVHVNVCKELTKKMDKDELEGIFYEEDEKA
jgi:ribosomal protein S25